MRTAPLSLALLLAAAPLAAQTPDLAEKVERLSREVERLKAEAAPAQPSSTSILGYGEIVFSRYRRDGAKDTADLRRFVLGVTHAFDADTELVTEVEVEHAVSSADDKGEVEIEQAYILHRLSPAWSIRAGLFLVPSGLLNERHEPTVYYGVERNLVETAIIPSTWREGGVQVAGDLGSGFLLQAGVSTGFDLGKWDASSTEGAESPLGAVHQELSGAKAHDLAVFGALNWRGVPGLHLGASIFHGKGSHAASGVPALSATLWEAHGRWTPGAWDLSALYARGEISGTAAFNQPLVGFPTLMPRTFDGWYVQAARQVWASGPRALAAFARFETVNTAAAFATLSPASLTPAPARAERVWTAGVSFNLNPHVVVKADVRRFREDRNQDRFNLGLGWAF